MYKILACHLKTGVDCDILARFGFDNWWYHAGRLENYEFYTRVRSVSYITSVAYLAYKTKFSLPSPSRASLLRSLTTTMLPDDDSSPSGSPAVRTSNQPRPHTLYRLPFRPCSKTLMPHPRPPLAVIQLPLNRLKMSYRRRHF